MIFFTCFLAFFVELVRRRRLSKKLNNPLSKFVGEDASDNNCTSLSCVRCSNSIFSTEKLLSKWSGIQRAVRPDKAVSHRIKSGLSRDNNFRQNRYQSPTVFYLKDLPSKAWYTAVDFPREVSILERKNSMDIFHSEFLEIYQDLSIGWVSNEVPSGGWYLFHLVNQGVRIEENCKRCPKTMKVIEELPLFMSGCAFGNIMFSVLLPGTIIRRHCGPTNVRIRCHVPLKAPDGYFICVAEEERSWKENEVLIFDDSFYHEVYHLGDMFEPRVVLMIDLWHPCLSMLEKDIITTLFSLH